MHDILCYSDLHFSDPHADEAIKACASFARLVREHKPTAVVNLGDTFHVKDAVTTRTLNAASKGLGLICDAAKSVEAKHFVISGNHDSGDNLGVESSASVLFLGGASLQPTGTTVEMLGRTFGFFGYVNDRKKSASLLKPMLAATPDMVFAHLPILYAHFNASRTDESSLAMDPADMGTKHLVAGHYHHPQLFFSKNTDVVIVGSPCYYTWGDSVWVEEEGVVHRGFLAIDVCGDGTFDFTRYPNRTCVVRHTFRLDVDGKNPDLSSIIEAHPQQEVRFRLVGYSPEAVAAITEKYQTSKVKIGSTSALRSPVMPDAPEVGFVPGDIDFASLLDRVLSETELTEGVSKDSVRKHALSILEFVDARQDG